MTMIPFERNIKEALDGKADKPISPGDLTLPESNIFIGQPSSVAESKSLTGDVSVLYTGETSLRAQPYTNNVLNNPPMRKLFINYSLSQVNAGQTMLVVPPLHRLDIHDVYCHVNGDWADGTSVVLRSESGSQVFAYLVAALSNNAWLQLGSSNVNPGSGLDAPFIAGDNLILEANGGPFTGGTSLTFKISYAVSL